MSESEDLRSQIKVEKEQMLTHLASLRDRIPETGKYRDLYLLPTPKDKEEIQIILGALGK